MVDRPVIRLQHIKTSIVDIRQLLSGKTMPEVAKESAIRVAFERYLEIISEASRHIPPEWKASFGPEILWSDIATIGNVLRHEYDRVDVAILWEVYVKELNPLERVIDAMLAAYGE